MTTEKLTFTGHDGTRLAARLDLPQGTPRAAALFAHCFTCGKDIAAARRVAAGLAAKGIAVLRFDFTGLGHSEGEFENSTFSGNVADLVLAADALAERLMPPALIVGHSLGGAAVVMAAPRIPSVTAVVTIGAPFEPDHVTHQFGGDLATIEREGLAQVSLAGRAFTISRDFVADIRESRLTEALATMKAALLVMHSPVDATVGIENASAMYLAAKHPKSFVTLDNANHLLSRADDAEYAASVIAGWADRYLPDAPPEESADVPEGVVRVAESEKGGFLQDVIAHGHHLLADEPASYGGTDLGPSPYGYVAAGLGACTSMTLRLYAKRKGWPLGPITVDVLHAKAHAGDANGGGKIDVFERIIRVPGPLEDGWAEKLIEIADKCPVHKTLEGGARVVTRVEAD